MTSYPPETHTKFGDRVAAARLAAKPFRIPQVTLTGEHNGERWAKAEASRKEALRRAHINIEMVYDLPQPQRSLGQVAHDAAVETFGYMHAPWSYIQPSERRAWEAAATAVRRAVGR